MIMDRNRLLMLAAMLAAVIVVAGGFFIGVQPQLASASSAQQSIASVGKQNDELGSSLGELKKLYADLPSLKTELAGRRASVPDDVETGAFITELNTVAKKTGVTVTNIVFQDPAAYVAPVTADATDSSDSAKSTASPSAAPTPAASTPASPVLTTDPLITAANFTDIAVSVGIQGTYAQALAFLQGLREGDRLFLITTLSSASAGSEATTDSSSTDSPSTAATTSADAINWTFGGLVYALADADSVQETQQSTTSTAADAASASSSTDTAAGK